VVARRESRAKREATEVELMISFRAFHFGAGNLPVRAFAVSEKIGLE